METSESIKAAKVKAVSDLTEAEWITALSRYKILEPIINNIVGVTVKSVAKSSGIGRSTLYRWLNKYKLTKSVASLVDNENTRGKGLVHLPDEVENIITTVIGKKYLNKQKLNITKISIDIKAKCKELGLKAPHYLTIRNRINQISEEQKLAKRYDPSIARNKYKPLEGSFPGADYPYAFIQIDHTQLDIIVVDEVYRMPVGRPWITMAIDVYSRMVAGFYISLDAPGSLGTGLCISNTILQKEIWLSKLDVEGKWPCYGVMKSIHLDNAKEFHGKMLQRACQEYGIEINFRPVATPNYGGHIERLLGTVLKEIQTLPGTTFSNHKDRKHYDAEGKACFTIKELEKWLATFITGVYHQRLHSGIGTTPIAKYNEGIYGSETQIGIGLSKPIENELKLKLDFMPYVERTIQRYGVSIDAIWYYSDVLKNWIYSYKDSHARYKSLRKFIFKRDPRDISSVYFFDPKIKIYFPIHYRNTTHPSITIWEYGKIVRYLRERGKKQVSENQIFEAYAKLKTIEANASSTTAKAKRLRNQEKKKHANNNSIKNDFIRPFEVDDKPMKLDFTKKYLPFEDLEG
jgi:putative transposase